jgi:hypothetical protein
MLESFIAAPSGAAGYASMGATARPAS